jgi:hypothetical protein
MPWWAFLILWWSGLLATLLWLAAPLERRWRRLVVALCVPMVVVGNIDLLLAAAAVLGLQRPAAWALPLLTKVTPGLGPLWFLLRREWRALGVSVAATAAIVALSFALAPDIWTQWLDFLLTSEPAHHQRNYPPVPLRVAAGVAVVVWGALTDRRWTLALAMTLAAPMAGWTTLGMLLAIPRLNRSKRDDSRGIAVAELGVSSAQVSGRHHEASMV